MAKYEIKVTCIFYVCMFLSLETVNCILHAIQIIQTNLLLIKIFNKCNNALVMKKICFSANLSLSLLWLSADVILMSAIQTTKNIKTSPSASLVHE